MGQFSGKVVLVTGASSGIGRAAVVKLASEGAAVVGAARREAQGRETIEAAKAAGGTARFIATDVADAASVDALFAAIERDYGRLDGAFNNAGVEGEGAPLPEVPIESYEKVFDTNVRGTWLCLRHEMRIMARQGHGAIVNNSSGAGVVGFPAAALYTASKHAIVGMTKSASLDFADKGIRVNCLCPGSIRSEMSARWAERVPGGEAVIAQVVPMKRQGTPEEAAAVAIWLLSDAASYVTGAVIVADGGYTVA